MPLNNGKNIKIDNQFEGGYDPQLEAMQKEESIADSESVIDTPAPEWYIKCSECYASTSIYISTNKIVTSSIFNNLMLAGIVLNTVTLSLDRYPISVEEASKLDMINTVCTFFFLGEMIFKLVGFGLVTYASDTMNQFDAFVVIISIVEFALAVNNENS